jgi:cytochrome c oxidase cbb3-type subunit IV
VISLMTFLGIVAWAWSRRNQSRFGEAAMLPFQDEATTDSTKEPS